MLTPIEQGIGLLWIIAVILMGDFCLRAMMAYHKTGKPPERRAPAQQVLATIQRREPPKLTAVLTRGTIAPGGTTYNDGRETFSLPRGVRLPEGRQIALVYTG